MKFFTTTLGCKVNLYETEALIANLTSRGWIYDETDPNLDVYIINTCTVTATSDQKSRQMIRQARRKYPNSIIVAMGCFVQTHEDDASNLADIVIGTNERLKVYDLVNEYLKRQNKINHVLDLNEFTCYEEMKLDYLSNHTRGFVKIQDGCENFCSYCLIPFARGKIKSRKMENIIAEIEQLTMMGVKEVIISGINTGTYGQDLGNTNLATLIDVIMTKTNLWRLRLSSIELMEVTDELLMVMKKHQNRIANHLHIPLQGGADNTLIRMGRKYLTNDYRNLILKIRKMFPSIAITTDCLCGFVGESEKDFQDSIAFIKEMQFASMHIFPYSRRKGTLADQMDGHLDPAIIKERTTQLLNVANTLKEDYMKKFINTSCDLLIEQQKGLYWVGHTSNYLEIYCQDERKNLNNVIMKCKIVAFKQGKLFGILEGDK